MFFGTADQILNPPRFLHLQSFFFRQYHLTTWFNTLSGLRSSAGFHASTFSSHPSDDDPHASSSLDPEKQKRKQSNDTDRRMLHSHTNRNYSHSSEKSDKMSHIFQHDSSINREASKPRIFEVKKSRYLSPDLKVHACQDKQLINHSFQLPKQSNRLPIVNFPRFAETHENIQTSDSLKDDSVMSSSSRSPATEPIFDTVTLDFLYNWSKNSVSRLQPDKFAFRLFYLIRLLSHPAFSHMDFIWAMKFIVRHADMSKEHARIVHRLCVLNPLFIEHGIASHIVPWMLQMSTHHLVFVLYHICTKSNDILTPHTQVLWIQSLLDHHRDPENDTHQHSPSHYDSPHHSLDLLTAWMNVAQMRPIEAYSANSLASILTSFSHLGYFPNTHFVNSLIEATVRQFHQMSPQNLVKMLPVITSLYRLSLETLTCTQETSFRPTRNSSQDSNVSTISSRSASRDSSASSSLNTCLHSPSPMVSFDLHAKRDLCRWQAQQRLVAWTRAINHIDFQVIKLPHLCHVINGLKTAMKCTILKTEQAEFKTFIPNYCAFLQQKLHLLSQPQLIGLLYDLGIIEYKPDQGFLWTWFECATTMIAKKQLDSTQLFLCIYACYLLKVVPPESFLESWTKELVENMTFMYDNHLANVVLSISTLGIQPTSQVADSLMGEIQKRMDRLGSVDAWCFSLLYDMLGLKCPAGLVEKINNK